MKRNWTAPQKNAIDSRGGTILVSAAAGSGKTAVLVQRIIERITDKEHPGSVDRLLVVTFTRAAAGEMRMRVNSRLNDELAQNPKSNHIKRQLMLLPTAKINTIDSFCSSLVRDNFHLLGISPDFMICSETQRAMLRQRAVEEAVEEMYSSENFALLTDTLTENKDDSILYDTIFEMHDFLMSYPFPEKWMDDCIEILSPQSEQFLRGSREVIKKNACEMLHDCLEQNSRAIKISQCESHVAAAYTSCLHIDSQAIASAIELVKNGDWDELCSYSYKFSTMPRLKSSIDYDLIKKSVSDIRNSYKKQFNAAFDMFSCDSEQLKIQSENILAPVRLLFKATTLFEQKLQALKKSRNLLDFSDLLHLTLKLLVHEENGELYKTELAKELSEQFDEILIDEYQDTNHAQNAIFDALSKDGSNIFMVGDIKQSIYRFRQAVPEIFMEKLNKLPMFDTDKRNYPAKILLDSNFRSRREITDAVNFIFSRIMSGRFGQIDYLDGHALNAAADYPKVKDSCVETLLIDCSELPKKSSAEYDKHEAAAIGKKILSMIREQVEVKDGDKMRPCSYGDFCILLQTHKNKAHRYFETLSAMGIPVWMQGSDSLFEQNEVLSFISLLKIFDNPLQDIDLLCALHSPIFGFTDDDICQIRLNNSEIDLYSAIKALYSKNAKCRSFIDTCERYHQLSYSMPSDRLISTFFEETSYPEIMSAIYSDPLVKSNLQLFYDVAKSFESQGTKGLCALLRHIDGMSGIKGGDINSANGISDGADVVRIMTIHKSKGLEFPICIIADNDRRFIRKAGGSRLLYHQKYGCATVYRDQSSLTEVRPLLWEALRTAINDDQLSENLRLLYVAMTRAKERLIFTMACDNIGKLCEKSLSILNDDALPSAFRLRNASCFSEWILCCSLLLSGARHIIERYDIDPTLIHKLPDDDCIDWSFEVVCADTESETVETQRKTASADPETVRLIEECANTVYQYEAACLIPSKLSVSELSHKGTFESLCASKKPRFSEQKADAASRGTILHRMMQSIDFVHEIEDVRAFADTLIKIGIFTPQEIESIDLSAVDSFLHSDFYNTIACADRIYREFPFSISMPVDKIEGMPKNLDESVVVEGIVDLIFVKDGRAYIVDYKSDRCFDEQELISRYSMQLDMYTDAVQRTLGLSVEKRYIYSIAMSKAIEVRGTVELKNI